MLSRMREIYDGLSLILRAKNPTAYDGTSAAVEQYAEVNLLRDIQGPVRDSQRWAGRHLGKRASLESNHTDQPSPSGQTRRPAPSTPASVTRVGISRDCR